MKENTVEILVVLLGLGMTVSFVAALEANTNARTIVLAIFSLVCASAIAVLCVRAGWL